MKLKEKSSRTLEQSLLSSGQRFRFIMNFFFAGDFLWGESGDEMGELLRGLKGESTPSGTSSSKLSFDGTCARVTLW